MSYAFEIRDVQESDRDLLRSWRNQEHVRLVSNSERKIGKSEHDSWFSHVIGERSGEVVVACVETRPVGVVQIEGLDTVKGAAGWGVYLGETSGTFGIGAVLPVIGLSLGFDRWGLRRMHSQILSNNNNAAGIHRRLGISIEGVLREEALRSDGSVVDVILYGVLVEEWAAIHDRAMRLIPRGLRSDLAQALSNLKR